MPVAGERRDRRVGLPDEPGPLAIDPRELVEDAAQLLGGDVQVELPFRAPLAEILATAPVMETMRKLRGNLKGACRTCEQSCECYGCRGLAYHVTGDFLEADPLCWHNPKRII